MGGAGRFTSAMSKPLPRLSDWITKKIMYVTQLRDEPKYTHEDNLHQPGEDGNVRGEWKDRTLRPSAWTRLSLTPALGAAMMAGVAVFAVLWWRRR